MDKKMKIVQINAYKEFKSTGRLLSEINHAVMEKGHLGLIVFSEGDYDATNYKMDNLIDKKIHALFSRISGFQGYFSKNETKKLIKFLSDNNPDIIHLHNLHANFINLPLLFEYIIQNEIATVITLHDCWFYTGNRTHYTIDQCYIWKRNAIYNKKCIKSNSLIPTWFFDQYKKLLRDRLNWFKKIDRLAVVGVSDWITQEINHSILNDAKIIKRIYNWVDLDQFKFNRNEFLFEKYKEKKIILGVASNWTSEKGILKFKKLAKIIDDDTIIILIGKINIDIELPNNIVSIPETNNINELVDYYSLADVFINFSLEETFGNVTAESLSCGTPVVVMNTTANPELVGNNCGYVSEDNSVKDVYKKIKLIFENEKDYYSKYCRNFVKENFNKNKSIKEYIDLYQELVTKRKR